MPQQFSLFDDVLEPAGPPAEAPPPPPYPGPPAVVAAAGETHPTGLDDRPDRLRVVAQEASGCQRCGLARTRTNVVFGEGNPTGPLVLVGEGPGENEDATGRPFVGRAGKLLDQALARNGMTREHVYICNVVKCRAANLEGGKWWNRPPTPDEISACQPWLEQQFDIIKPVVVVCVGAPSANTIIHKGFRITSERGKWFTNSPYAAWAMAVFHPAYILRLHGPGGDAAMETLVEDLGRARQKVIEVKRQAKEERAAAPPRSLFD